MIETYKNISTTYYLFGILPIDAAVLVIAVFPFLIFGWWAGALVLLIIGYRLCRKVRERHYDYIDLFIYLTTPGVYGVDREKK